MVRAKDWEPEDLISSADFATDLVYDVLGVWCWWSYCLFLSHRFPSHVCFRCNQAESSLFLLMFRILRGFNFCCSLKLLSYNIKIKAKQNGNYKILLAGLVWFFNGFKSDSTHIIALFSESDLGLVHIIIFACIFIRALCTKRLYFNLQTRCGRSFDVLHLAHANLNKHVCNCFKKCFVNRTTQE